MDSGGDEVLGPGTETTADSTPAAKPSPDSTEPSSGRRGSRRRVKTAVTSPDSGDSRSGPVRVLRARGAEAGRTSHSNSPACKIESASVHRGRGRPAGSRVKNTPVMQPAIKKSTANKVTSSASKRTIGPKLSKSRKGKGRPQTRASSTIPETACKPEAETETSSCGEDASAEKGSNDNVADPDMTLNEDPPLRDDPDDLIHEPDAKTEKSRHRTKLRQKDVKKKGPEKEEEENGIKKEETTEPVAPIEDGAGDNKVPPRKRGRRDDKAPRPPKRRKKPPVQYVRCEMEGCGTVLAHPRYLQHHIKYQHLLKKKYVCDHPSCGRLFRLQKQLLRHAKHHTDQRDYICEFCARAFKSSHNLAVHRMIHTGEKPIQCEICGFTCRQKASLNWHMKKHDAESSYQFPCSICGKKFEKKDSVVAHKAKSHPEVLIAEALAANEGSVISSPAPALKTVPVVTPSVGQESQEAAGDVLTPLQQVVLPLAPQTELDVSQGHFLQLPTDHMVQVAQQQQQAPTLLHLTTASPAHLSSTSHPQLIQLSTLPPITVTSMVSQDSQSTLLTLSSVTTLAPTASLTPQQAVQWGGEADENAQVPGEGELWERVVVGEGQQSVGEIIWEGHGERRKENEGIVWEREGERQILLQCAEVHGDSLI